MTNLLLLVTWADDVDDDAFNDDEDDDVTACFDERSVTSTPTSAEPETASISAYKKQTVALL